MAKGIFRQFFGKQVAGILAEVHLVPELRARILDKLDNAPLEDNILFTDSQLHASKEDLLSALLTLLISDAEEINETVPALLAHIETHFERLSDFHQGVYWHLKGYLAWRNDRSHYHAIAYLNRSHKILKGSSSVVSDYYRARVYDTMGQISYHLGHMEEAVEDFGLAISLRPPDLDSYGRALTYGSLGRVHMDLGNYDDAIEFLSRDLEIMRRNYPQMTQIQTQLLSNLGLCHRENQQLNQAEKHYQESLKFAKNSQHAISLFFAYVGLGKIAVDRKNLAQATAWEDKAISTFQAKIPDVQLEIKGNLKHLSAQIAMLRGDLKAAASHFKEGLKYYQSSKFTSPTELASFLLDYAQVTTQLEDRSVTARILEAALTHLDATSATEKRLAVERLLKKEYRDQWILHSSRRLTGRDALEKLLEQTGSPGFSVEKNKVVVMFADMRGFTRISEGLQPEELITLLNAYLTSMIRAVNGQDGYVVQIQGDAILAVFSLPETRPDDAERSMLSGLTMLEQNERLNNRNLDVHPVINIGIGMHYGEVVTGLIGSPLKRSYTMIGDVVNTASRIEGLTKVLGFPILVTLDLKLALIEPGQYLFMPLGKYILYGKKEAISIFALLGASGEDPQALDLTRWVRNAEEAFVFFENRDFDAAIKKFNELAHMTKISGFDYLIRQSYHFQKEPPGPEWEGSITLDNK